VAAEQRVITERSEHEFEDRIAAARAAAERLRNPPPAAADPSSGRAAPVPELPAAATRTGQAAGEDRLPAPDALTATEQAIQLDELIKWVKAQAEVDPNGGKPPSVDSKRQ
jgi:hypothetical protein